jgi:acyl-CoA reductase-like NAD-dependent aldehyde dehydrogenase
LVGEQHLADRGAVKWRTVADLEVDRHKLGSRGALHEHRAISLQHGVVRGLAGARRDLTQAGDDQFGRFIAAEQRPAEGQDLVSEAVNARDKETDVGPLISEQAARSVEAQVARAVTEGATVEAGGRRRGAFFEPTVLTGRPADSPALQEEVFGPVLPLIPFEHFEDALTAANLGPYGLQAALFTRHLNRVMQAFQTPDVGRVVTNHSTAIRVENLPFGGTKMSGNAREGLHETLLDMTEQKTLLMSGVFPA